MADITADQIDSHDHHPTGWRRYLYWTEQQFIECKWFIRCHHNRGFGDRGE